MKLASRSKTTVLITGIDSFTGVHLKRNLERSGFCVFGTSYKVVSEANVLTCDITNKSQVLSIVEQVKPNYVVHLAGISFVGHTVAEDFYKVNVIGTQNLLEALHSVGSMPEKVVLASSATVYGNQGIEVLDETLCPMPTNHYGISKLAMEHMSRNYFDKLPIVITRPFNYVGVGQPEHFVIPKIVKHFKAGAAQIELGNIQVEREFNNIQFACEVYHQLLTSDAESVVVNLCSGKAVSLMGVIDTMQNIAGYQIDVRVNPDFVRPNELPRLVGSTELLFSLTGEVKTVPLKKTLEEMYLG